MKEETLEQAAELLMLRRDTFRIIDGAGPSVDDQDTSSERPAQADLIDEEKASQESSEYNAEYPGSYASAEQQEYIEVVAGDDNQQQKIYPQQTWSARGKALGILAIGLSSLGFFISVAGIVISALVLRFAHGQEERLVGGVIGLVGSIVVMLVCIAIFVTAVIVLALRGRRGRRWTRTRM